MNMMGRIPDELLAIMLSFLPLKEAVATSVLSRRWLNLWRRIPNLKSDKISQLPDEIIIYILSFLSLREAAATSVLSSRWSDLWKRVPNLNFNAKVVKVDPSTQMPWQGDSWDLGSCKYMEHINSVLHMHKAPSLKEFKISLFVNKLGQRSVTKWLDFALSRQVETLELNLICHNITYMISLDDLLRESIVCSGADAIWSKSLKRLCLNGFKVSGEAVKWILHSFPLLEQLVFKDAVFTSDVEVCGGDALVLKHLDIYSCTAHCSIKVSAPNLAWLRVYALSLKLLFLENVPRLIEADFTCKAYVADQVKHFASAVFCCISRLKILKIRLFHPKPFFTIGFPRLPDLNKLLLTYYGEYEQSLLPITDFIWASPRLQEFKFEFFVVRKDTTVWEQCADVRKHPPNVWERRTDVRKHPHRHLKVLRFRGFSGGNSDHIELVTYIVDNCPSLEKIVLDCRPRNRSEQAGREYAKQQLYGKVPDHIQLCLGPSKWFSDFD